MAAATVYSTPGPGVTTITKVVTKNATPTQVLLFGCREHTRTVTTSVDAMLLGTYLPLRGVLIAMTRGRLGHHNAPQSTREAG